MKEASAVDTEKLSACMLKDYLRLCVSRNPSLATAYAISIWHMGLLCDKELVVMPTHTQYYKAAMQTYHPNPLQFSGSIFFVTEGSHKKLLNTYQQCINKQQRDAQRCVKALETAENAEIRYNVSQK